MEPINWTVQDLRAIADFGQLNNLVSSGIVEAYPPLVDVKGSYTAQLEHVRSPPDTLDSN